MPTFTRDGATLHYELDGSGPPAVYISGFGSHSNDVLAAGLRQAFGQQYTVLSVDNRGSGQTVVEDGAVVNIDIMADDIAAIMDHHDLTAADVLGISMGGCVALTLALRHPDKVRRLVVAVSFAASEPGGRGEFLLRTGREMRQRGIPRDILNRFNAVILLGESVFQYEALMEAWVNAPPDPFEQNHTQFTQQLDGLANYDVREAIKTLTVPTLVMSSPDDILVPQHFQDEIAAAIPGATIQYYPGGHVFMLLPMYSAQFVQDVMGFWGQ
jgi:3-oxoadipate enol-lactonase